MENWDGSAFDGAKVAILVGDRVLCLQRDDTPGLAWRGLWDLPGGGREAGESPIQTIRREVFEELGLQIDPARLCHAARHTQPLPVWFFVMTWPDLDLATVRFGQEGQRWAVLPVAEFIDRADAIQHLRDRLASWWLDQRFDNSC